MKVVPTCICNIVGICSLISFITACSQNCRNGTKPICNEATLKCLHGCKTNYEGDMCDTCVRGKTGPQCNLACGYNCLNCTWDPVTFETGCALCRPGYYYFNQKCESCNTGCKRNASSDKPRCDPINGICNFGCIIGWAGGLCNIGCQSLCVNRACHRQTECCTYGCTTPLHGGCRCTELCNSTCENDQCFQNKSCIFGCKLDHWGFDCLKICSSSCSAAPDNTTSTCDRDGSCIFGCKKTYWGLNCSNSCLDTCIEKDCDASSGHCLQSCEKGYWNKHCDRSCSTNCPDSDCYSDNGTCIKDCPLGRHGLFCNITCPVNCLNDTCIKEDGNCALGCRKGYTGDKCRFIRGVEERRLQSPSLKEILDPIFYTFAALVFIGMTLVIIGINRKRFKCCRTKQRKEHKISYVNLGVTSTVHNNSSKEHHTNRIQGDNNIYERLHRENGADDHPYGEISNKINSRRGSTSGNEINLYELIHREDVTKKNQYRDVAARVSVSEVKDDNVNFYQQVQAESESIRYKNETLTNTIEEVIPTVEVSGVGGKMYEKLQKPLATEHLYGRTIVDDVSGLIVEIDRDISYENVSKA